MNKPVAKKTWSGVEWGGGFDFRQYNLDGKILDYKLMTVENTEVTVEQVWKRFQEEPFESVVAHRLSVMVQKSGDDRVHFTGTPFTAELVALLLSLQKEGINPFETSWFCYDKVHGLQNVMDIYRFFIVHKNSIVREHVGLADYPRSGFDPGLFQKPSEYPPIWADESSEEDARAGYWYKRFYTETKTGQMYMLSTRPRPYRTEHEVAMAHSTQLAASVSRLLWVVIVLLVLIGLRVWL